MIEHAAKEQEVDCEASQARDHQRIEGLVVRTIGGSLAGLNVSQVGRVEAIVGYEH